MSYFAPVAAAGSMLQIAVALKSPLASVAIVSGVPDGSFPALNS